MRVQVKLCYQNWWNYYHRIYTIAVTEDKSGSENVKNGLYNSFLNSYFDLTKSIVAKFIYVVLSRGGEELFTI